mgnify:FL=1
MKTEKVKLAMSPCCVSCKSTTSLSFDASAEWNINNQSLEFDLVSVYCNECHHIGNYGLIASEIK